MQDMFGEISLLLLPLAVIFLKEDNWDPTREAANDFLAYSSTISKKLWYLSLFPQIYVLNQQKYLGVINCLTFS